MRAQRSVPLCFLDGGFALVCKEGAGATASHQDKR